MTSPPLCRLRIRVSPRAASDAVVGWLGDRLKVRLAAVPEAGRANAALVALLAQALDLPQAQIKILSGLSSRDKTVEIQGLTATELAQRLPSRNSQE
jgi:uncharacterized protein (TIGR00251 family)